MTATEREQWRKATKADPCPICGHDSWCRVSPDGAKVACRRESAGGKQKEYKNGERYFLHTLRDDGPAAGNAIWPTKEIAMGSMRRPPVPEEQTDVGDGKEVGFGPLLLTAKKAAAICGKSLRTWRTWDSAGWIPRPVRIGRSTLWRADELREWVSGGCPRREEWEARTC